MGLWDKIRAEFIDIVEWSDDGTRALAHRFERRGNEIKNGAKLVVREGQAAVFVREGKLADVLQPGMYTLDTKNLPILSTLLGWKYGFESPFKAEVYFITTRAFTDLKWGTRNPIMLRDPEFGPIRLRAFGSYCFRVSDPGALVQKISGTDAHFTLDEVEEQLRSFVNARFADILGENRYAALDLAAKQDELASVLRERLIPDMNGFGLETTNLVIENISFPPEVEAALDKRSSMGIVGDLQRFTQFQAANAIEAAAKNPQGGGMAAGGLAAGLGLAMGQTMATQMSAPVAPPPLPQAAQFFAAINGQQVGPLAIGDLINHIRAGTITRETLVWKNGLPNWVPAGGVQELAGFFQAPPPLPVPPPLPR
jgi:membrane protease subunit (stomatin/prohibitin family)